jgi:hypothetical protein
MKRPFKQAASDEKKEGKHSVADGSGMICLGGWRRRARAVNPSAKAPASLGGALCARNRQMAERVSN